MLQIIVLFGLLVASKQWQDLCGTDKLWKQLFTRDAGSWGNDEVVNGPTFINDLLLHFYDPAFSFFIKELGGSQLDLGEIKALETWKGRYKVTWLCRLNNASCPNCS